MDGGVSEWVDEWGGGTSHRGPLPHTPPHSNLVCLLMEFRTHYLKTWHLGMLTILSWEFEKMAEAGRSL